MKRYFIAVVNAQVSLDVDVWDDDDVVETAMSIAKNNPIPVKLQVRAVWTTSVIGETTTNVPMTASVVVVNVQVSLDVDVRDVDLAEEDVDLAVVETAAPFVAKMRGS